MASTKKPRVNIEFSPEKYNEFKLLIEESGCSTQKEFFNSVVTLYKWMKKKRKEGRHVGAFKDGMFIELDMPILDCEPYNS